MIARLFALVILAATLFALPARAQFDGDPGARPRAGVARAHGLAGRMVLLQQQIVPSGGITALQFRTVLSPLYDAYRIDFIGAYLGTNGQSLCLQLSSDGGQTYIATGYEYAILDYDTINFGRYVFSSSYTCMEISDAVNGTAQYALNGYSYLWNPWSTTTDKTLMTQKIGRLSDNNRYGGWARSWYTGNAATPINAFKIISSSGTIAGGTFRVYGIINR